MNSVKTEIKKGDTVRVMCGKNDGKQGKVLVVNRVKCQLIVEGVNLVKKHQKPNQKVQKGGIIEREGYIYASKVMLVCPKCSKPTRIAHFVSGEGKNSKKVRSCKKCSEMIDQI
jgi:large subunit ribosomal protein L24